SFGTRFTVAELLADSDAPAAPDPGPEEVREPAPAAPAPDPAPAAPQDPPPPAEQDAVGELDEDGVPVRPSWLGRPGRRRRAGRGRCPRPPVVAGPTGPLRARPRRGRPVTRSRTSGTTDRARAPRRKRARPLPRRASRTAAAGPARPR